MRTHRQIPRLSLGRPVGVRCQTGADAFRAGERLRKQEFTEGDPDFALLIGDPDAAHLNARIIGHRPVVTSVTMEG